MSDMLDQPSDVEIDEVDADQPAKKKRGRPKNENYLSFEEAREFIRSEMLPSRGKFFEWWDRNKPKAVPRFPYRVYEKEWTTWNDFLGTNNKFNEKIGTKWRSLTEATVFVHTLKIKTQTEWLEFCRTSEQLPADIPARPDLVYDNWRSWGHWLGNKPVEAMQEKREQQKIQVYYITHDQGTPLNVLNFGIETTVGAMKERWERDKCDIVRMFWWDPAKANVVKQIIDSLSSPYLGYERQRIVPNVWEIIYLLQMHLDQITSKDVS